MGREKLKTSGDKSFEERWYRGTEKWGIVRGERLLLFSHGDRK